MSQRELDEAIKAIRDESAEDETIRITAGRVFRRIFDATHLPDPVSRIRSCSDFQSLIPAYLSQTLPPSRALLLRDHTLECVACRRALHDAQGYAPQLQDRPAIPAAGSRRRIPVMAWGLAATLAIGIAVGITGARYGLLPGQNAVRATVSSVEGKLYRVSKLGTALIEAGTQITNADEVRTAPGSRASLRLVGGGELEIGERTDISLSPGWKGTTVSLEQGRIIAQTTDVSSRGVYIAAVGVFVPVRDTVLAVDQGTKGSRVAVAKGSTELTRGGARLRLIAGQQMTTNGLQAVPIASEFAWSRKAGSYLALVNEFSNLEKQIQGIPSPGLRYSSDLAKYVANNAVLYAAIPNLGGTITEAKRIFDERLAESDVLRSWWNQQPASHSAEFDNLFSQVSSVSQFLGDEIVFSLATNPGQKDQEPLLLADVRQAGLAEYLKQSLPPSADVQVVTSVAGIPTAGSGHLVILVLDHVLAASTDPVELTHAAQLIQNPALANLTGTPFYARIAKSYEAGAEYLFAIDLNQVLPKSVSSSKDQGFSPMGNAQYLVFERRTDASSTDTRASLAFSGERQGVASWLGSPGAVGSLDFVSPDATAASSFIVKSPRAIIQELLTYATAQDPAVSNGLSAFESRAGVSILDDVAAPLGDDVTFAIDGPLLPVPSWKLAIEVNDPARLQQTLTTLIDRLNQEIPEGKGKVQLGSEEVSSQTFYWLRSSATPNASVYYTFVDGYLLAGASEGNLLQAIQNRQAGYTLASSTAFRNELPSDSFTNFSGMLYMNAQHSVGPVLDQLKSSGTLTTQQKSLSALLANTGPGLICIYGQPDEIVAATRGSFLGFHLGALAGLHQGQPLVPLIASTSQMQR